MTNYFGLIFAFGTPAVLAVLLLISGIMGELRGRGKEDE